MRKALEAELKDWLEPGERLIKGQFRLRPETYAHSEANRALQEYMELVPHRQSLLTYYRQMEQGANFPDLLGKTAEAGPKQFARVYRMTEQLSRLLGVPTPRVFIYEELYYRSHTEGVDFQWIELSSALVEEFTNDELAFILGRELGHIQGRHFEYDAIYQAAVKTSQFAERIPFVNIMNKLYTLDIYQEYLKAYANRWKRIATYSEDACGLLCSGSIAASVAAVKKLVLNNPALVDEVDLTSFVAQSDDIAELDTTVMKYTKLDEPLPYAPHRLLELIRFGSSARAKRALFQIRISEEERRS
ncbi:M48 family metallopeptidase [Paenibacillus sp.]|uniref:M48 family metallopeptidase n=1 Tax=Paenibacillus sp. TaxID=58172 RepID=UPI002D6A39B1|nr:M48 family metallopeptidase [Paenibacillus sp.]HZG85596.1 M48 family metallopeptidase [Paenibacillus sp.]